CALDRRANLAAETLPATPQRDDRATRKDSDPLSQSETTESVTRTTAYSPAHEILLHSGRDADARTCQVEHRVGTRPPLAQNPAWRYCDTAWQRLRGSFHC